MAEIPVLIGNEYYKNSTETHYEGYVETRAEVANASTDWAVGSIIVCSEDWSKWVLGTSSGTKTWLEAASNGGGGGGGGNSNLFDVLFFIGSGGTNTCSADLSDILDAITAGKHIVAFMQTDITGFEGVDANATFTFSDSTSFEAHFFVPQHTNPITYANFHVTYDSNGVSVILWA